MDAPPRHSGTPGRLVACVTLWTLLAVAAGCTTLFGPPRVRMEERYTARPDGPVVSHATFDALLRAHVDDRGGVDYEGLTLDQATLDEYLDELAAAPIDELGRDERLALLINAYNAATLRLILDEQPVDSIRDIPAGDRWKARRWTVGGRVLSLDEIEHEEIRPAFAEPRIHFAVVCAAVGCPPLRAEAYTGDRLEDQLRDQTVRVHSDERWYVFQPESDTVGLTRLYDWYGDDFRQIDGSILALPARVDPRLASSLNAGRTPRVRWLPYDWSLNTQEAVAEAR